MLGPISSPYWVGLCQHPKIELGKADPGATSHTDTFLSHTHTVAEACGSKSVYDGPEQEEYSTFIIDDPQETYKTLKQVIAGVGALEQEHAQYRRDKFKKTRYGSQ